MQTTRIALVALTALLAGCSVDRTPVTPSDARPHFDGNHTFGSGNRTTGTEDASTSDTTAVQTSGVHTFGSGN